MRPDVAGKSYTYRRWVGASSTYLMGDGKARSYIAIQNEGNDLFVKLGAGASLGDYTYRVPSNGILEVTEWAGPVTGIRSNGAAFAMCTETV